MPPLSNEQIRRAKEVGILAYLQANEPRSLRKSKGLSDEYFLADHNSLKISNGKFHWFSRGVGGSSALDFLMKVRGMRFMDAVRHLTDGTDTAYKAGCPALPAKPSKPFSLPAKNVNNDRVYAYLRGRGISGGIIQGCFSSGILYESKNGNCVFVGYDGNAPRFACERGTKDRYMKDVAGSNKAYSFVLPPDDPDSSKLACLEAPVDCLSHASIHKLDGERWDGFRLSLGGVGPIALMSFLGRNPQIENVWLCLDSDKVGKEATTRIIRELLGDERYSHLKITLSQPPIGKDYNDTLQAIIQLNKQKTRTDRSKEADFLI